jgi:Caspase domain
VYLYALLVGIDRYRHPDVPDLRGCGNDVRHALEYLRGGTADGTQLRPLVLRDAAATRDAVVSAIRSHLGSAGPDDTALFWFSGHGSQARVPDWAWFREPTGMLQTLVCADSRSGGVPDLWDKELSGLLDDVAADAGHVAVVLDSCHSDGASRDLHHREPATRARAVPAAPPRDRGSLIPEAGARGLSAAGAPRREHVALAASQSFEAAQEMLLDHERRGLFSWALLRALRRLGSSASYRDLIAAAQTDVERRSYRQVPQLRPIASELADHAFLNGTLTRPSARMRMRYARAGWEVDAGAIHGLPDGAGVRVGVHGSAPPLEAEVTRVFAERSLVSPAGGWSPAPAEQFPVVLTAVARPRIAVAVAGAAPGAADLRDALLTARPGDGPSLYVRPVRTDDPEVSPDLRATVAPTGALRITDRHGDPLGEPIADVRGPGARRAVAGLEHIARWQLVLDLENDASPLAGAVRLEIVDAEPGDTVAPRTRTARRPDPDGGYRLCYRRTALGWEPPDFFIRLHNTGSRRLYCVLLDLSSRFRVQHELFPGDFIGPGERGAALDGQRIRASLPDDRRPEPGLRVRDRLKLIVAEEQFSARPFVMPALGGRASAATRGALGGRGLLERLGAAAVHRDLAATADPGRAYDWTTDTVSLITEVPS